MNGKSSIMLRTTGAATANMITAGSPIPTAMAAAINPPGNAESTAARSTNSAGPNQPKTFQSGQVATSSSPLPVASTIAWNAAANEKSQTPSTGRPPHIMNSTT